VNQHNTINDLAKEFVDRNASEMYLIFDHGGYAYKATIEKVKHPKNTGLFYKAPQVMHLHQPLFPESNGR
jgi:hypothetical protein